MGNVWGRYWAWKVTTETSFQALISCSLTQLGSWSSWIPFFSTMGCCEMCVWVVVFIIRRWSCWGLITCVLPSGNWINSENNHSVKQHFLSLELLITTSVRMKTTERCSRKRNWGSFCSHCFLPFPPFHSGHVGPDQDFSWIGTLGLICSMGT